MRILNSGDHAGAMGQGVKFNGFTNTFSYERSGTLELGVENGRSSCRTE